MMLELTLRCQGEFFASEILTLVPTVVTCLESISSSVGQNTVLPISIDRRLEIYKKENRQTTLVVIVQ